MKRSPLRSEKSSNSSKNLGLEGSYSKKNLGLESNYSKKNIGLESNYSKKNLELESNYSKKNLELESNSSKKNIRPESNSGMSSRRNISHNYSRDFSQNDTIYSSPEIKLKKLDYKKFCNKVEIMTKKGFLEYFHLEELEGTLLSERLYACFSPIGSIDFQKFYRGTGVLTTGSLEDRILFFFTMFDIKRSGSIEKSDMKKVLLSLLNVMIEIESNKIEIAYLQEDVKNMTPQEREEAIEILLEPYGQVITYENFSNYIIKNDIIRQALEQDY